VFLEYWGEGKTECLRAHGNEGVKGERSRAKGQERKSLACGARAKGKEGRKKGRRAILPETAMSRTFLVVGTGCQNLPVRVILIN
jgi:hypothetical protein